MLLSLWTNWWDDWEAQWKCTFDGESKTITVNSAFDFITVKDDIYSAWKEWVKLRDNTKFPPALRVIGGDPVGGGLLAGDIYFLVNGWQVVINHRVSVSGVLYHDDGLDPYLVMDGGGVISTVSNLVQTATTGGSVNDVDYDRIESIVQTSVSTGVNEVQQTLSIINNKLDTLDVDVDLTDIMNDLLLIQKKIDETQAFVLASD